MIEMVSKGLATVEVGLNLVWLLIYANLISVYSFYQEGTFSLNRSDFELSLPYNSRSFIKTSL